MEPQTSPLATMPTAERKAQTTYTFREITEATELEEAFRLRYDTYQKCCNIGFINLNNHKIDFDPYDMHSKHYSIFDGSNVLVANIRVVLNRKYFQNDQVINILKKNDLRVLTSHDTHNGCLSGLNDFPFLSYSNVPGSVKSHYQDLISDNSGFAEVGRLIIKEEYRGIKLSAFLLDCVGVLFITICQDNMNASICCDEHHSLLYERFGFKFLGDGNSYEVYGTNKLSMYLSPQALPEIYRKKFQAMAAEYQITGKITRTI